MWDASDRGVASLPAPGISPRIFNSGGGAAFSIDDRGMEQLVVVQEVLRPNKVDLDAVAQAIRAAILAEQSLPLHALVFIRRGTLPKTSSGKVQRLATRQKFLDKELEPLRHWTFDTAMPLPTQWADNGPALPSESAIRDADFASETAALTRAQILVQANTSVLAQANAAPQNVLALLRA